MKNDQHDRKRFSWVGALLLIGHLAIIAGLGISALSERPRTLRPLGPAPSILDGVQADVEPSPR